MSVSAEITGNRVLVQIVGELTIFQAAEIKPALLDALRLSARDEIEVDLAKVTEIDTSGVQLMLMLKREAARLEKNLAFTHHSRSVLSVVDILNLGSTLGDPVLLSARHGT